MTNSRLSVEYSTAIYDSEGKLLPDSPLNKIYAMEGLFAHVSAVGKLLELVDEDKLANINANAHSTMLENLGSLCSAIGDAGFYVLLKEDWPSLFDTEEQSAEAEQAPTEETNLAANAVAA